MVWGAIAGAVVGGLFSKSSADKASKAANREGARIDALEREKFAEAKKQAEILRKKGDEAAAVAMEEAEKADLGAERFEDLSNEYARSAEKFAETRQTAGLQAASDARDAALARQEEGRKAALAAGDAAGAREAAGLNYAGAAEDAALLQETAGQGYAKLAQDFAKRNEDLAGDLYRKIGVTADELAALGSAYGDEATAAATRRESLGLEVMDDAATAAIQREELGLGVLDDATAAAQSKEQFGRDAYGNIQAAERENALRGEAGAQRITGVTQQGVTDLRQAADDVMTQAERAGGLQTNAYGNIENRYSPFLTNEARAAGQLGVEMGLVEGDQYTGYRDNPAYQAATEASTIAERDARQMIEQDAANTGTLYSGRRMEDLMKRSREGSYERAGIESSYYQNYLNMLQQTANPNATGSVSQFEAGTARDVGQNYIGASNAALGAEGQALDATMRAQAQAEQLRQASAYTGTQGSEYRDTLASGTEGANYGMAGLRTGEEGANYGMSGLRTGLEGADATLGTARTGEEGAFLRDMIQTGDAGANYRLGTMQTGTEGAPYQLDTMRTGMEGVPYRLDTMSTGVEGVPYQLDTMRTGVEGYPYQASGFDYGTAGSGYRMSAADYGYNAAADAGGLITGNMPTGVNGSNYRMQGVEAQNAATADIIGGATNMYTSYMNRPQPGYTPVGGTPPPNATANQWNSFYGGRG